MLSHVITFIVTIAITLIIAGTQKYLSTRKSWLLGAIIPTLTIAIITALFYIMKLSYSTEAIISGIIIIVLELFIWADGRFQYKQMGLRKMKAKDI